MGVLTDRDILERIEDGSLQIDPFDKKQIQPASLEISLGTDLAVLDENDILDAAHPDRAAMTSHTIEENETFLLEPHTLVLAHSLETIAMPDDLMGWFEGRSSLARIGLLVHVSAGLIHPGSKGKQTFELYNLSDAPIRLETGIPLAQIVFEETASHAETPYHAREDAQYVEQERPDT